MEDATPELLASRAGDRTSFDALFGLVYEELHSLARARMSGAGSDHTLQPTALVNEVYLRLVRSDHDWRDRAHFLAVASRCVRHLLIDHARRRFSQKRGGGALRVTWNDFDFADEAAHDVALLDLDELLRELERQDERKARVVELRFFGGLSVAEVAEQLDCSEVAVKNDWRFARAWLQGRLDD